MYVEQIQYNEDEKNLVKEKGNRVLKIIRAMGEKKEEKRSRKFFHYTSIPVLFNILENDSMWVSNTRFSNDGEEEKVLEKQNIRQSDNYMACFCDKGDLLSQWRGYCSNGGASIEFELNSVQTYSILYSDYEKSGKYELVYNTPIPVIYVNAFEQNIKAALEIMRTICENDNKEIEKMIPYWKNDKFKEERESRLVFVNADGRFSKCIRFRTLSNGAKVPYMIIKTGDIGLFSRNCQCFKIDLEYLKSRKDKEKNYDIVIPEGNNQEQIFNEVNEIVNKFNKDEFLDKESYVRVYCAGHLPIKKIMLAPTYDRERLMEKVKRFCQSKYWLRNVEVVYSEIPYIPPSE